MTRVQEESLALRAVLHPAEEASEHWNNLLELVDGFHNLNPVSQRLAPLIFRNLQHLPPEKVREYQKLKGSYRSAWAHNHEIIHSLRAVFRDLEKNGIPFRVIKGIAVQLSLGTIGSRRVGDLDLLISRKHLRDIWKVLSASGFECNSLPTCPHISTNFILDAYSFNKGAFQLDVHVAERKEPVYLLKRALTEKPVWTDFGGNRIPIPPPELLLLHSIFHGSQESGPSDLAQGIIDVSLLSKIVTASSLLSIQKRVALSEMHKLLLEAQRLDVTLPVLESIIRNDLKRRRRRNLLPLGAVSYPNLMMKFTTLWKSRWKGLRHLVAITGELEQSRLAYGLWVSLGRFTFFERKLFKLFGGFLRVPPLEIPVGCVIEPFSGQPSRYYTSLRGAGLEDDYRFRIKLPAGLVDLKIELDFNSPVQCDVVANGRTIQRILGRETSTAVAHLPYPPKDVEISIRTPSEVCSLCFPKLHDLKILVDYR